MTSKLVESLQRFSDPQSESQLNALDAAVQGVDPESCTSAEHRAMFEVFERFPEDDGFEVFWGILHALEACSGYESELLASVQRKPCEFNVLMINRLLNGGISEVAGVSLTDALRSVLTNDRATPQALLDAREYLARHEGPPAP